MTSKLPKQMKKKIILTKRINKTTFCLPDEVLVRVGWFERLYEVAQRFEKDPNPVNRAMLLGYISSARFIVDNFVHSNEKTN